MVKRSKRVFIFTLTLGFIVTISLGQTNGYLAQKLMIENDLRKRIASALEKVIDNRKYVVDVSVDLEISSAIENQTTYSPSGANDNALESLKGAENLLNSADTPSRGSVGLPIPGFDFTAEPPTKDVKRLLLMNLLQWNLLPSLILCPVHKQKHARQWPVYAIWK